MRIHVRYALLFALLIPSLAWAGNTCTTTSTGSNWSSASHWTCTPSGTVPGSGDVAIISNNTTVDVNTTVGQSGPSIIAAASYPQSSLSQSAGGGSLPAGAYRANFTNVDSGGKESAIAYESGSFTLTASDTLIITMGALPAGVSSRNVYLTAAGGAAGSETLYATGVTTSTYNMTSASWTNGTTTQAAATALPANNWAIQVTGGSLTLATNVTLTVHGDVKQGNEGIVLSCGSEWLWDSSTSAGGTSNAYYDLTSVAYSQPNGTLTSTGSCSANPWTLTSKLTGGAPGGFTYNANTGYALSGVNLAYGYISNCGSATAYCLKLPAANNTGNTIELQHVLLSNDGELQFASLQTSTNLDIEECTWSGSLLSPNLYIGDSGTATGTRTFKNNVFDLAPELNDTGTWGAAATGNYFDQGWNVIATPNVPMTGNFIRQGNAGTVSGMTDGNTFTNNYFLVDYWPTATVTSTATSSTASTLVDTSQSWTTNAYQASASNGWEVLITGGTGINQLRSISSNTATTLTVSRNWTTNPDNTSTYAIYNGPGNLHIFNTAGISGTNITHSGNIADFTGTQADGLGHFFLIGSPVSVVTVTSNIVVPDGSGLNLPGTLTISGASNSTYPTVITHNTAYVGNYTGMQVGDYSGVAGMIGSLKNDLFWVQSSVPSATLGGSKAVDTGHPTSGGVQNYIAPSNANYNACWNCQTMGYDDNGYGINLSSAAGGNDVNLSGSTAASGPNFVDPTRNFIKWCQSLGTTGTLRTTIIANCRASMMSVNNFSGAQTAYTPAALVTYVTAGFAPQNVLLHNTASDGTDIGAVAYQALPSATLPVHSAAIF